MRKPRARSRILKEPPLPCGGHREGHGRRSGQHRNLVHRRGAHRPEDQGHAPLGTARNTPVGTARPAHRLRLYFRGDLSEERQGRCPGPARLQHRGDEPASGRDCQGGRSAQACRSPARPGRLASVEQAGRSDQYHLLPLPPKCPELNPQENTWQFMRDNWLSNRVFKSYDDILDHCCYAWNRPIEQPWRIMSIRLSKWAYRF